MEAACGVELSEFGGCCGDGGCNDDVVFSEACFDVGGEFGGSGVGVFEQGRGDEPPGISGVAGTGFEAVGVFDAFAFLGEGVGEFDEVVGLVIGPSLSEVGDGVACFGECAGYVVNGFCDVALDVDEWIGWGGEPGDA